MQGGRKFCCVSFNVSHIHRPRQAPASVGDIPFMCRCARGGDAVSRQLTRALWSLDEAPQTSSKEHYGLSCRTTNGLPAHNYRESMRIPSARPMCRSVDGSKTREMEPVQHCHLLPRWVCVSHLCKKREERRRFFSAVMPKPA